MTFFIDRACVAKVHCLRDKCNKIVAALFTRLNHNLLHVVRDVNHSGIAGLQTGFISRRQCQRYRNFS